MVVAELCAGLHDDAAGSGASVAAFGTGCVGTAVVAVAGELAKVFSPYGPSASPLAMKGHSWGMSGSLEALQRDPDRLVQPYEGVLWLSVHISPLAHWSGGKVATMGCGRRPFLVEGREFHGVKWWTLISDDLFRYPKPSIDLLQGVHQGRCCGQDHLLEFNVLRIVVNDQQVVRPSKVEKVHSQRLPR